MSWGLCVMQVLSRVCAVVLGFGVCWSHPLSDWVFELVCVWWGVESALVTMLGGCDLLISQAKPAKGGEKI